MSNTVSGLSASSTTAQIEAVHDDNAGYHEGTGDLAGCQAFMTACRMLIRRYTAEAQKAGAGNRLRLDENIRRLDKEVDDASEWLATATVAGNVPRTPSFQFLRGY